jgi:uncharacterized caspase-like protein
MDPRVLIRQERERSDVAGPMAGLTVLLENSNDLVAEGDALSEGFAPAHQKQRKQASSSKTHRGLLLYHYGLMRAIPALVILLSTGPRQSAHVPAGTRVEARLESVIQTATSNTGDSVVAVLAEPVRAAGKIVVPQGSRLNGRVETIQAATRANEGRVRLAFREIAFPDGRTVSTWITNAFSASPPKRNLRYVLYMGIGATAGGLIGGKTARVTGIIGGTLAGFVIAGASGNGKLPDLVLKRGKRIPLVFGEDLQIE